MALGAVPACESNELEGKIKLVRVLLWLMCFPSEFKKLVVNLSAIDAALVT